MTCASCQTTRSERWTGKRTERVLCWPCYQREWQARRRALKRPKVYQWEGA